MAGNARRIISSQMRFTTKSIGKNYGSFQTSPKLKGALQKQYDTEPCSRLESPKGKLPSINGPLHSPSLKIERSKAQFES